MGYRVEYGHVKKLRGLERQRTRVPALTALFLLLFFALVQIFWEEGAFLLRHLLIPGDPDVTVDALETFARELQGGEGVKTAFSHFCKRILEGANLAFG